MKNLLYSALLLSALGCAKSTDPTPATVPATAPPVTFTDAAGANVAVTSFSAYSVTATPTSQTRRAVLVRAVLATGSTVDVTFTYVGNAFPASGGTITLDEAPLVDYYGGAQTYSHYRAASKTQGVLISESTQPVSVSGSYTGPLTTGGGNIKLTYSKLTF